MLGFFLASAAIASQSAPLEEEATTEYDYGVEAPAAEAVAEEGADIAAYLADPRPLIAMEKDGGQTYARPDTRRTISDFQLGASNSVEMWFDTDYKSGRQLKTLWRFQCTRRTLKLLSFVEYDAEGQVTHKYKDTKALPWAGGDDVIPDSVGETMMKVACAKN